MNTKSKIFPDCEYKLIQKRLFGDKSDRTGLFCSRVRPKIIEMFEIWEKQKTELLKIVEESKKKKRID